MNLLREVDVPHLVEVLHSLFTQSLVPDLLTGLALRCTIHRV